MTGTVNIRWSSRATSRARAASMVALSASRGDRVGNKIGMFQCSDGGSNLEDLDIAPPPVDLRRALAERSAQIERADMA